MGTTQQKFAYSFEAKELIKQGINNLGGDITSETTFRQYADKLQTIYDNAPKTDYAEGSNITLENCLKGKLDYEDNKVEYGDSYQYSTTGKNFFFPFTQTQTVNGITVTPQEDGSFIINGTNTSSGLTDIYSLGGASTYATLPNYTDGDWTLSDKVYGTDSTFSVFIVARNSNNVNTAMNTANREHTYSLSDIVGFRMFIRVYGGATINNIRIYPQFEKGSSSTPYEKYTGGIPAPNPDYPQDIEVVRGKNRLDDSNLVLFNSNKYISTTNFSTQGKIAVNPSTTYTLIYKANTINDMGMWEFDSSNNKTAITYTASSNGNYNIRLFTTLSTTKTMSFYAGSNDTYTSVEEFLQAKELMILEGDYSSQAIPSYLPYNTLEVVERGKNLFNPDITSLLQIRCNVTLDKDKILVTAIENGDIYVGNVTNVGSSYASNKGVKIPVKPLTTYTFSSTNSNINKIFITEYDSNDVSLGYIQNVKVTTKSNTKYITIRYGLENAVSGTTYETYLQIETGSTATTYEPYQTPQTYQLSLGEYEFAKIGNYVDTIEYDVENDKVYKNENIIKQVVTSQYISGLIAFNLQSINSYGIANFLLQNISNSEEGLYDYIGLCNYLSPQVTLIANEQNEGILYQPRNVYIRIKSTTASTNQEFKTYVDSLNTNGNPLIIYRPTSAPTLKEITGTLKDQVKAIYNSHSFTGTTIIEINGNLPMILKVRALKGN